MCSILAAAALTLGGCKSDGGLYGDDELARYAQRSDKITLSAGDAKEVNAAAHTIHPWPRGVNDRRIAANGERMARAVDRYRRGPGAENDRPKAVGAAVGAPVQAPAESAPGGGATTGAAVQAGAPSSSPAPPAGNGSY